MKILHSFIFASLLVWAGCTKDDHPTSESHWWVNGTHFKTNDAVIDRGKVRTDFFSRSRSNGFRFVFHMGSFSYPGKGLPLNGTFKISNSSIQDPANVSMSIYVEGVSYGIKYNLSGSVTTTDTSGKAKLTVKPTWFKNYQNSDDTILVSGIFYEP